MHKQYQELIDSVNKCIYAAGSFLIVMTFFLKWLINPCGLGRAASVSSVLDAGRWTGGAADAGRPLGFRSAGG